MPVDNHETFQADMTVATSCNCLMRARNFLDIALTEIMDARNVLLEEMPDEADGQLKELTDEISGSSNALQDSVVRIMGIDR